MQMYKRSCFRLHMFRYKGTEIEEVSHGNLPQDN